MEIKTYINSLFNLGKLTIFLVIIGDILRKTSILLDLQFTRYTALSKAILLVVYGLFTLFFFKQYLKSKEIRKLGLTILALILLFVASNIFPFSYSNFNIANTEYLIRYLFFPFTLLVFYDLFNHQDKVIKLFKLYEFFFIANMCLIVVSFAFNFELLKSYPNPNRFGYSGIFNRTNHISYITILMIIIYYFRVVYFKKKDHLKLLSVIAIALLIGTKKIYFSIVLLGIFHLYKFRHQLKGKKTMLILTSILLMSIALWKSLTEIFISNFSIFIDIYEEKGFLSSLLSFRNDLLIQIIQEEIIPKWNIFNILFGGADFTLIRPEMEFFDLLFFFGVFGILIYLFWIKIFLKTIDIRRVYIKLTLFLFLLISFFSSGFFISVNFPFLFFIGIYYLNDLVRIDSLKTDNY